MWYIRKKKCLEIVMNIWWVLRMTQFILNVFSKATECYCRCFFLSKCRRRRRRRRTSHSLVLTVWYREKNNRRKQQYKEANEDNDEEVGKQNTDKKHARYLISTQRMFCERNACFCLRLLATEFCTKTRWTHRTQSVHITLLSHYATGRCVFFSSDFVALLHHFWKSMTFREFGRQTNITSPKRCLFVSAPRTICVNAESEMSENIDHNKVKPCGSSLCCISSSQRNAHFVRFARNPCCIWICENKIDSFSSLNILAKLVIFEAKLKS